MLSRFHDWTLCQRFDCRDRESAPLGRDRSDVRQWLRQSTGDVFKMLAMRTLLSQIGDGWKPAFMPDAAVIDCIVELLVCGRLHVHGQPVHAASAGGGQSQGSTAFDGGADREFAPYPISEIRPRERSARVRAVATDADPETFSSDTDAAAQADSFRVAAALGAAALEICLRS